MRPPCVRGTSRAIPCRPPPALADALFGPWLRPARAGVLGTALRRSLTPTLTTFAAPKGGAIRALGLPCGAHGPPRSLRSLPPMGSNSRLGTALRRSWTPTLTAFAAPNGEQFAPWDCPAALMDPHAHCVRCPQRGAIRALGLPFGAHGPHAHCVRCPQRGSNSRLGTALRRSWTPTLTAFAAPKGGAIRALGLPCGAHGPPRSLRSLPPKGERFAPWDCPAALMDPTLTAFAAPKGGAIRALGLPCGAHGPPRLPRSFRSADAVRSWAGTRGTRRREFRYRDLRSNRRNMERPGRRRLVFP